MSGRARLVAVHHRLSSFVGHRCQEALGLAAESRRCGFEPVLLISSWALPEVRTALPEAHAVLHDPVFGPESFDERTSDFVGMLHAELDARVAAADVVLMTVATQCEVRAFALWLAALPAAQRPRVVFLFHNDRWNRDEPARQAAEMRVVATELARLDPAVARRLVIGATTDGMARDLSLRLGVRVHEAPLTHTYAGIPRPRPSDVPHEPPVVGYLSGGRPERGALLVGGIVDACRRRVRVRSLVHLVNETVEADAWEAVCAIAEAPDVDTISGELAPEVYGAMLARCDLVVLPYDRAAYRRRQSAVLADAVVAGKPVVVPSGTWLADMVGRGAAAGRTYEGGVDTIADAVADCIGRLPALQAQARDLVAGWIARQSLPAFFDWMAVRLAASAPA